VETKAKQAECAARHYVDNKAKRAEYAALYYGKNKAKFAEYAARRSTETKVKLAEYGAWYRGKNKMLLKASAARKRGANKDRTRIVCSIRKVLPAEKARLRAYRSLPATKERVRARNKARALRVNAIEKDYVTDFLQKHPDVQPKSHLITNHQIECMFETLLDSRSSKIIDALKGFTLREAFIKRKLYASIYPWLARGTGVDKRPGQNYAECVRFLVKDPNPILTNGDEGGKHYRTGTDGFNNLGLVSITLAEFDTASACSRFESYVQKFLDTRRYGIEKLFKQAGAGKLYQLYRRCDVNFMIRSGDHSPVFTCGITVLHDVRMASCNAANHVTSMRSGEEGQLSLINKPARWEATFARNLSMFG
jgi:hypothetical protein